MRKKESKIHELIFFLGLFVFIFLFAVLFFFAKKINYVYKPYIPDNLYLVFSDSQEIKKQIDNLDFLLADLKALPGESKKVAVVSLDYFNQNKDFNLLLPKADSVYVDIFSDKSLGSNNITIFKNNFNFKMPFEVKSYLSPPSNLNILYYPQNKIVEFVYPGQNLIINQERLGLNDFSVFKFENIEPGNLLKIGDLMINLSNYENDLTTSLDNLLKNNIKIYQPEIRNLLVGDNYSFETGLWSNDVADCSAYLSGQPDLAMALKNDGTDGHKSLELSASNHFACTLKSFPVKLESDKLYKLAFDYKNVTGKKVQYYYNLQNDLGQIQEKFDSFDVDDANWHTFETVIVPQVANITNFNIYFYAPADGSQKITNQYDNIRLNELAPKEIYSYYLYSTPEKEKLSSAPLIKQRNINNWKSQIILEGINDSLLLVYPTEYSQRWKMYPAKEYSILARFLGKVVPEKNHFRANNYANSWWLDFDELCVRQKLCELDKDGNYRIDLIVEHDFNKFINLISLIAGFVFVVLAFYFIHSTKNQRHG